MRERAAENALDAGATPQRRTASGCASSRRDGADQEARVPGRRRRSSTPRAGTASRSTRPAAATAPARSARCASSTGDVPVVVGRPARLLARRAAGRLAARLPRAGRGGPRRRGAAAADAAEGGARRRRPARDPPPGGAEALPRARRADARGPGAPTSSACSTAMDDLELRVPLDVLRTLGGTLRAADWKVTAVVVDDLLLDVEPGDTTGAPLRDRVRPRHDDRRRDAARPRDRPPAAVRSMLNTPAAVRRGRDLADLGDDARSGRARALRAPAHETLDELAAEVCEEAGVDAARGLRDRRRRQRDDDPARARDRPGAALDGAVHDRRARAAATRRGRLRRPSAPARARAVLSPRSAPTSAATSSPACWPPA